MDVKNKKNQLIAERLVQKFQVLNIKTTFYETKTTNFAEKL